MAALVQSFPQSTGSVTLFHTRPTSASGMLPTQAQQVQQYGHGNSQQRNSIHGLSGSVARPVVYRGTAPVQPYAFTSTPSLNQNTQWQPRTSRTSSMPSVPTAQAFEHSHNAGRPRYLPNASMTNLPTGTDLVFSPTGGSRDDSAIPGIALRRMTPSPRLQPSYLTATASQPAISQPLTAPGRVTPDRYRRPSSRTNDASGSVGHFHPQSSSSPSGSGMASVGHLYNQRNPAEQKTVGFRNQNTVLAARPSSYVGVTHGSAVDDMQLNQAPSHEEAKRFRRRSLPALDSAGFTTLLAPPDQAGQMEDRSRQDELAPPKSAEKDQKSARLSPAAVVAENYKSSHIRRGSADSRVSSRSSSSRPSSVSFPSLPIFPTTSGLGFLSIIQSQGSASQIIHAHPSLTHFISQSANRNTTPTGNPALLSSAGPDNNQDYKLVNIPPRSSSSDAATTKRVANPSPLSRPATMGSESDGSPSAPGSSGVDASQVELPASPSTRIESAAVKQLSAIREKNGRLKSKTSRLRRAFSFGSAADFKKAAGPDLDNEEGSNDLGHSKLHKEPTPEELYDAEQARIAQKQEAAGLGNNIYAGGRFFAGSTDNLSVSSTASSASIMIRKMGRGMKKGGRSLVGLFRPKSVVSVPSADVQLPEASQAAVSMITVEAERQRVNVNPDPHTQNGGGTGFPHLERNSMDTLKTPNSSSERLGSSGTDNSAARRSIVGGEKERAEVLAAVRKGILKRKTPVTSLLEDTNLTLAETDSNGSSSPKLSEERGGTPDLPIVPQITDSPNSSAPSTPNDDVQGHRRTGSIAIGNEDYFVSALRLRQDTKSAPGTPQGSVKRNATFSPRIIFYDTWPSGEYDRRGEIATCNRLTPMLAQQIKEELNNFKMVITSTHF